mmetsp:Transcript_25123/g.57834  ORF Transcript_25123/g.57834 Transcript_25123/m.57834 type:complete len:131 (-) Transcript_25123:831-1223(-)
MSRRLESQSGEPIVVRTRLKEFIRSQSTLPGVTSSDFRAQGVDRFRQVVDFFARELIEASVSMAQSRRREGEALRIEEGDVLAALDALRLSQCIDLSDVASIEALDGVRRVPDEKIHDGVFELNEFLAEG